MLDIHKRAPQGFVFGLQLFPLYINNFIPSADKFEFVMHADNTIYYLQCTDVSDQYATIKNTH